MIRFLATEGTSGIHRTSLFAAHVMHNECAFAVALLSGIGSRWQTEGGRAAFFEIRRVRKPRQWAKKCSVIGHPVGCWAPRRCARSGNGLRSAWRSGTMRAREFVCCYARPDSALRSAWRLGAAPKSDAVGAGETPRSPWEAHAWPTRTSATNARAGIADRRRWIAVLARSERFARVGTEGTFVRGAGKRASDAGGFPFRLPQSGTCRRVEWFLGGQRLQQALLASRTRGDPIGRWKGDRMACRDVFWLDGAFQRRKDCRCPPRPSGRAGPP